MINYNLAVPQKVQFREVRKCSAVRAGNPFITTGTISDTNTTKTKLNYLSMSAPKNNPKLIQSLTTVALKVIITP